MLVLNDLRNAIFQSIWKPRLNVHLMEWHSDAWLWRAERVVGGKRQKTVYF